MEREVRGLTEAGREFQAAKRRLLVLTRDQIPGALHHGIAVQPAGEWMLDWPKPSW
jgi:hypothetical protein